jgi:hypothetical protein
VLRLSRAGCPALVDVKMKIALFIEDGLEQIVLTPESETERGIVGKLHDGSRELSIRRGKFYECKGGWVTQGYLASSFPYDYQKTRDEDESTMIVLRPVPPPPKDEP